jgi:hypothetical protein
MKEYLQFFLKPVSFQIPTIRIFKDSISGPNRRTVLYESHFYRPPGGIGQVYQALREVLFWDDPELG